MRIKSYFAPSVQSAIAMARREFGDEVTLVTSHIASADARHLGEYEVVFAVDEDEPAPEVTVTPEAAVQVDPESEPDSVLDSDPDLEGIEAPDKDPAPKFTEFQEALLGAVAKKPAPRNVLEQIDSVRSTLIELGIEPPMVRALMTLVERSIDASALPEPEDCTGVMLSQLADSLTAPEAAATAAVPNEIEAASVAPAPKEIARTTIETAVEETFGPIVPRNFEAAPQAAITTAVPNPQPQSRLSAAELAFVMSVSEAPDTVRR
jgi:hypothetical protein